MQVGREEIETQLESKQLLSAVYKTCPGAPEVLVDTCAEDIETGCTGRESSSLT